MAESTEDDSSTASELNIKVKSMFGTVLNVTTEPSKRTLDLKKEIYRLKGVPERDQQLIFNMKVMDDMQTLEEVGLAEDSIVDLVLKMRGGPNPLWKNYNDVFMKRVDEAYKSLRDSPMTRGQGVLPRYAYLVFQKGTILRFVHATENRDGSLTPSYNRTFLLGCPQDGRALQLAVPSLSTHPSLSDIGNDNTQITDDMVRKMAENLSIGQTLRELRNKMQIRQQKRDMRRNNGLPGMACARVRSCGQLSSDKPAHRAAGALGKPADAGEGAHGKRRNSIPRDAASNHTNQATTGPVVANKKNRKCRRKQKKKGKDKSLPKHAQGKGKNNAKLEMPKAESDAPKNELPSAVPKKRARCQKCNRRLNMIYVERCRCGQIFCPLHRLPETHSCTFDFKTDTRKENDLPKTHKF